MILRVNGFMFVWFYWQTDFTDVDTLLMLISDVF